MEMNNFLKYETLHRGIKEKHDETLTKEPKQLKSEKINVGKELDELFPQKSVKENGEIQTLRVSRNQASMFEIYKLRDDLDSTVKDLEEEQTGFSDRLRSVYDDIFDELIRQEIIECPERGLMLAAIKKEATGTLNVMQNLYRSSFAYAVTKDLLAQRNIIQKRNEIPELILKIDAENKTLQNMNHERFERIRSIEESERIKDIERTFKENQLIIANRQMVNQIEDIIDAEHKWLIDMD